MVESEGNVDSLAVYCQFISMIFAQENIEPESRYLMIIFRLLHVLVCAWIMQTEYSSCLKLISYISQQKQVRTLIDREVDANSHEDTPTDIFLKQLSKGVFVFNPQTRAHELNSSMFATNSVEQKRQKKKVNYTVIDDIIYFKYLEALITYKKKDYPSATASLDLLLKINKLYWPAYFLKGIL